MGIVVSETTEGLHYPIALAVHSRTRFTANLLPLLRRARGLRRVVTVFTGGKEGAIDFADFQGWKMSNPIRSRSHASSIVTLTLESLAARAPDVAFVHHFPGVVKSGSGRDARGPLMAVFKAVFAVIGPLFYVPLPEVGERHLYAGTSAMYPPAREPANANPEVGSAGGSGAGVALVELTWSEFSKDLEGDRKLAYNESSGIVQLSSTIQHSVRVLLG